MAYNTEEDNTNRNTAVPCAQCFPKTIAPHLGFPMKCKYPRKTQTIVLLHSKKWRKWCPPWSEQSKSTTWTRINFMSAIHCNNNRNVLNEDYAFKKGNSSLIQIDYPYTKNSLFEQYSWQYFKKKNYFKALH